MTGILFRIAAQALCYLLLAGAAECLAANQAAFLLDTPVEKMGPEARAALEIAKNIGPTTALLASSEGRFRDEQGREVALDKFAAIWYHQGDSGEALGPAYSPITVVKFKQYAMEGHGLLLSGAALGLVQQLGLEPFATRRAGPGTGPFSTGLIPVETKHPVFKGLQATATGVAPFLFNDTGYAAFSDFHGTGGPLRGMLLACANSSTENPLVEYELGGGRVIVLGWRVPHYSHADNPHRKNLLRLTANLLEYLTQPPAWQKVVVKLDAAALAKAQPGIPKGEWGSLQMAIQDLMDTFKGRYPRGKEYLEGLGVLRKEHDRLMSDDAKKGQLAELGEVVAKFKKLKADALLANPLIDFERLMFIERSAGNLGLPANWESDSSLKTTGYDNRLCMLSPVRPNGKVTNFYEPSGGRFLGDVDLHWNADRLLFSMPANTNGGRWRVFEMGMDGTAPRELPLIREPDVDNYDACYLPDGRIVFTSTATFVGVPCVYGSSHVANLYIREHDGSVRQLTVDQEHNWCPTVLNNGRILYLRWEYTDLPHSNSRRLFHMNPDGTGQMEYLSSGSYFPNSFFYARPISGHPTMVVGIATGHHGNARAGRLLLMDPARGRQESAGVVQEIPGFGQKVEPIIKDQLADGVFPQFLHPFPLSEKYFLVSARMSPNTPWGIYLVDIFDNMLCLVEKTGYAMLEPLPVKRWPVPPQIQDKVEPQKKESLVYLVDVYQGPGLRGIPRGVVKSLRLITYHFSYQGMGGLLGSIGMDGPWDIKEVLGTVPVEADGSALFTVPAYTPISVQPLDSEGKALQLMRSWFTGMPGEFVSCTGCHEQQNTGAINRNTMAGTRAPSAIAPWYGPTRGFSFAREVQPVLDRHCVGCHNGQPWINALAKETSAALAIPDFRKEQMITNWNTQISGNVGTKVGGKFSAAYAELHRFVRRPGIESDIHLLSPMEFHADSTELVQMLRKGHHDVQLDRESWDRLLTWIDLNAPYHGTWREIVGDQAVEYVASRARAMRKQFTGMDEEPESIPNSSSAIRYQLSPSTNSPTRDLSTPHTNYNASIPSAWAFDATEAQRRQRAAGDWQRTLDLGNGVKMGLARIPAGEFVMGAGLESGLQPVGANEGEAPASLVKITKAFWLGRCEVDNEQYARFDPSHDSHFEPMHGYQFGIHGYPVNGPKQPVVRVSWLRAMDFCRWLSQKSGLRVTLPTEAQWEYACRAGTASPFYFGGMESDFSPFANLGDIKLRDFALETYIQVHLIANPNKYDDWIPHDNRFNDGGFVSTDVGSYRPNAWGLHDMHGNVWEWTRSTLKPYPYQEADGRNALDIEKVGWGERPREPLLKVVRGGSWYDRPMRCTSSYRLAYQPYQGVFNVGFRVMAEEE